MRKPLCVLLAIAVICSFSNSAYADSSNSFSRQRVGDIVEFGSYEQDNNYFNGKEPIRWIVVEKFSNCIKLVSEYVLDSRAFGTGIWDSAWENSDVRSWLNNDFYNTAFRYDEQKIMELGKNHNQGGYYVADKNNTYDMVWLLNIKELNAYFGPKERSRVCYPTAYASANGAYTGQNGSTWWWTRTPGEDVYHAAYVGNLGNIDYKGNPVNWVGGGIRPVILISTTRTYSSSDNSGFFTHQFCSHCGAQIPADSNFCKYCGYPVRK